MVHITGGAGILNAYFIKYITWNLKIVLKGKALGKSYEELLPKVNLRAEELVARRDILVKGFSGQKFRGSDCRNFWGSEFGEDVGEGQAAIKYKEKGDLRIFDTYLDHAFYHDLGRAMTAESQSPDVKKVASTEY